jgi:hypothetical protein
MSLLIDCIQWFSYGWTVITFPAILGLFAFSYWAAWDNEKHYKKISEMMKSEDEEDLLSPNQQPEIK